MQKFSKIDDTFIVCLISVPLSGVGKQQGLLVVFTDFGGRFLVYCLFFSAEILSVSIFIKEHPGLLILIRILFFVLFSCVV